MNNYTLASLYNLDDEIKDLAFYNETIKDLPSLLIVETVDCDSIKDANYYSGWVSDIVTALHCYVCQYSDDRTFDSVINTMASNYANVVLHSRYGDVLSKGTKEILHNDYVNTIESIVFNVESKFNEHAIPAFEDQSPYKLISYDVWAGQIMFRLMSYFEFKDNYKKWNL